MKLLLDENLPEDLRNEIPGHQIITASYAGYSSLKNGELLRRAAADGFEAIITTDQGIEFQQNLRRLPLSIVVLDVSSTAIESIRPLLPALLKQLNSVQPCSLVHVKVEA